MEDGDSMAASTSTTLMTPLQRKQQEQWDKMFQGLVEFYTVPSEDGKSVVLNPRPVPQGQIHAGKSLCSWVNTQRKLWRNIECDEVKWTPDIGARFQRLEEIGFDPCPSRKHKKTKGKEASSSSSKKPARALLRETNAARSDLKSDNDGEAAVATLPPLTPQEQRHLERLQDLGCTFPLPRLLVGGRGDDDSNNNSAVSSPLRSDETNDEQDDSQQQPATAAAATVTTTSTSSVLPGLEKASESFVSTRDDDDKSCSLVGTMPPPPIEQQRQVPATTTTDEALAVASSSLLLATASSAPTTLKEEEEQSNYHDAALAVDGSFVAAGVSNPFAPFETEEEFRQFIRDRDKLLYELDQDILRAEFQELLMALDSEIAKAEAAEQIMEREKKGRCIHSIQSSNEEDLCQLFQNLYLDWDSSNMDDAIVGFTITSTGCVPTDSVEGTTTTMTANSVKASLLMPKCLELGNNTIVVFTPEDVFEDLVPSFSTDELSHEHRSTLGVRLLENKQCGNSYILDIVGHAEAVESFRGHFSSWIISIVQARKDADRDSSVPSLVVAAAAKTTKSSVASSSGQLVGSSWENFCRKYREAVKCEFSRSTLKLQTVLGHMWVKHKDLIGPECHERCDCIFRMPELLQDLVADSDKGYLQGFMTAFAGRVLDELKDDHPHETSTELLQRLLDLYRTEASLRSPQGKFDHHETERNHRDEAMGGATTQSLLKIPRKRRSPDHDAKTKFHFDAKAADNSLGRIPKRQKKSASPDSLVPATFDAQKTFDSAVASTTKKTKDVRPTQKTHAVGTALAANTSASDPHVGSCETPAVAQGQGPPLAREGSKLSETVVTNPLLPTCPRPSAPGPPRSIMRPPDKPKDNRRVIWKVSATDNSQDEVEVRVFSSEDAVSSLPDKNIAESSGSPLSLPTSPDYHDHDVMTAVRRGSFLDLLRAFKGGGAAKFTKTKLLELKSEIPKNSVMKNKLLDIYLKAQECISLSETIKNCFAFAVAVDGINAIQGRALEPSTTLEVKVFLETVVEERTKERNAVTKNHLLQERRIPLSSKVAFEEGTGFHCTYNPRTCDNQSLLIRLKAFKDGVHDDDGLYIGYGRIRLKDLYKRCLESNPDESCLDNNPEKRRYLQAKVSPHIYPLGAYIEPGARVLCRATQECMRDKVTRKIGEVIQDSIELNQCTGVDEELSGHIQVAGSSLLHAAVAATDVGVVEQLLKLGADALAKNSKQKSAVSLARNMADGRPEGRRAGTDELNLLQQRRKDRRVRLDQIVERLSASWRVPYGNDDTAYEEVVDTAAAQSPSESVAVPGGSVSLATTEERGAARSNVRIHTPGTVDSKVEQSQTKVEGIPFVAEGARKCLVGSHDCAAERAMELGSYSASASLSSWENTRTFSGSYGRPSKLRKKEATITQETEQDIKQMVVTIEKAPPATPTSQVVHSHQATMDTSSGNSERSPPRLESPPSDGRPSKNCKQNESSFSRIAAAAETVVAPASSQFDHARVSTSAHVLPDLANGWLDEDITEAERCSCFDGRRYCNQNSDCPHWHVYMPLGRYLKNDEKFPLSSLAKGDVFDICHTTKEVDVGGKKWFTAGYKDARLRRVIYAESISTVLKASAVKGFQSDSGVWWYPSQSEANKALRTVISFATNGEVFSEAFLSSIVASNTDATVSKEVFTPVGTGVVSIVTAADRVEAHRVICTEASQSLTGDNTIATALRVSDTGQVKSHDAAVSCKQSRDIPGSGDCNKHLASIRDRSQQNENKVADIKDPVDRKCVDSSGQKPRATTYSKTQSSSMQETMQPVGREPMASGRLSPRPSMNSEYAQSRSSQHPPSRSLESSHQSSYRHHSQEQGGRGRHPHHSWPPRSFMRDNQYPGQYWSDSNGSSFRGSERHLAIYAPQRPVAAPSRPPPPANPPRPPPVPPRPPPAAPPLPPPAVPPVAEDGGADGGVIPEFDDDDLPYNWKDLAPHRPPFRLPAGKDLIRVDGDIWKWFHKKWIFRGQNYH